MLKRVLILFVVLLGGFYFVAEAATAKPDPFNAAVSSACEIDLSWHEGSPGAWYFSYDRSQSGSFSPSYVPVRDPASDYLSGAPATGDFSISSINLFSNTNYYYRIKACDSFGSCSGNQAAAPFPALTGSLPAAPQAPVITDATGVLNGGKEDITIDWSEATTLSSHGGYSVWRSGDGGTTFSYIGSTPNTFYSDLGLAAGQPYVYYVRAFDTDLGCKFDPSNTTAPTTSPNNQGVFSGVSTPNTIIPVAPSSLTGSIGGTPNAPTVILSWQDNSNAPVNEDNFEIWKSTDISFPVAATDKLTASQNVTTLTDSAVNPTTTYYYKIRACTRSLTACSPFSNILTESTGLAAPVLNASLIYFSPTARKGDVYLSWQGIPNAQNYDLERSTDNNFATKTLLATKSSSDEPNFYDSNLAGSQIYYYRLKAYNASQSIYSSVVSADLNIKYVLKGTGWASADQGSIGWLKFNAAPENGSAASPQNYSVQIDKNGLVSGEAWTDSYGWLSFNQADLGGCPTAPCSANFDSVTGMSGWARFLTPGSDVYPPSAPGVISLKSSWGADVDAHGSLENSLGGWVRLGGNVVAAAPSPFSSYASIFKPFLSPLASLISSVRAAGAYGVSLNVLTQTLFGEIWGGNVTGWINTSSTHAVSYSVRLMNQPPTMTSVTVAPTTDESWCADTPSYLVSWTFSDPEDDTQTSAVINFVQVGETTPTYTINISGSDTVKRFEDPLGYNATGSYDQTGYLKKNTQYVVKVQVTDSGGGTSEFLASAPFTTPLYYYPLVYFHWSPTTFDVPARVDFTNDTIDRTKGALPDSNWTWHWDFTNFNLSFSTDKDPKVIVQKAGATAALKATFYKDGPSCQLLPRDVNGGGAAPTGGGLKRRIFRER